MKIVKHVGLETFIEDIDCPVCEKLTVEVEKMKKVVDAAKEVVSMSLCNGTWDDCDSCQENECFDFDLWNTHKEKLEQALNELE